jgi:hypothetical protein
MFSILLKKTPGNVTKSKINLSDCFLQWLTVCSFQLYSSRYIERAKYGKYMFYINKHVLLVMLQNRTLMSDSLFPATYSSFSCYSSQHIELNMVEFFSTDCKYVQVAMLQNQIFIFWIVYIGIRTIQSLRYGMLTNEPAAWFLYIVYVTAKRGNCGL